MEIQVYAMSWLVHVPRKTVYVIPAVSGSLLEMAGNIKNDVHLLRRVNIVLHKPIYSSDG